jgi:class 3 adenylate cyclase
MDHVMWAGNVNPLADEIEEFLTGTHSESEPDRVLATVLFTDIVDSTRKAGAMGDRGWHALLDEHDRIVRAAIDRFRGREIKTLGDGFLATFDGPARAVRCASAIIDALHPLSLNVRCGVHTGEVEMKGDDIGGIAVHIAARIASLADGGDVLVSRTVRDLVAGSDLPLEERGDFALKGLSERMPLYAVAALQRAGMGA